MTSTITSTTTTTTPTATEALTPVEIQARADAAIADLEERRASLLRRTAAIPGAIAEELAAIAQEESQARAPLAQLESDLTTFPARIGSARAAVTMAQGAPAVATAAENLERLLEDQKRAEEQLSAATATAWATLAECGRKRIALEQEQQDYNAQLAEISSAMAVFQQQKRAAHAAEGLQLVKAIQAVVEERRAEVAGWRASLELAEADLRTVQERIPAKIASYRDVPEVVAAAGALTEAGALQDQKSAVQILIDAELAFLDALDKLRGTGVETHPTTWQAEDVIAGLSSQVMQQILGAQNVVPRPLIEARALLHSIQVQEQRRLAGLS